MYTYIYTLYNEARYNTHVYHFTVICTGSCWGAPVWWLPQAYRSVDRAEDKDRQADNWQGLAWAGGGLVGRGGHRCDPLPGKGPVLRGARRTAATHRSEHVPNIYTFYVTYRGVHRFVHESSAVSAPVPTGRCGPWRRVVAQRGPIPRPPSAGDAR